MDKSLDQVYRKQLKLQNGWANTIHQCLDAGTKPKDESEYEDGYNKALDEARAALDRLG